MEEKKKNEENFLNPNSFEEYEEQGNYIFKRPCL